MIKHIVMWKLKDFAEGSNRKENALIMKSKLEGLTSKIQEIRSLEVGINLENSTDSFDVVLCSEFKDTHDLQLYLNHPAHVAVSELISQVRLERKVVDYETQGG